MSLAATLILPGECLRNEPMDLIAITVFRIVLDTPKEVMAFNPDGIARR